MASKKKFYVTTAIDYPNAEPHIGHAYQKVLADVLARWHKQKGEDVWFLTGTDEHGKKVQESAERAGKKPSRFVDELSVKFKDAWKALGVDYNRFIRTTDKDHEKLVQEVIKKSNDNGDIYLGEYEGLYCTGCEAYYTEKDLVDGKCPLHNRPLEVLKEESYFFRLSKYQDFLLDLYKKHPEFILPKERRNEIVNRVKEGLKDLSISRTSFDWGIKFPLGKGHIVYVWFDALFNYVTGAGKDGEFWPADVHILGKDNSWFHCVYWPAFLKSVGYDLPKTILVNGFLTFNGKKISKSLGNAISPVSLVEKYGVDAIRYYLCRNFVFGEDGDFSEGILVERYNNELANKLGNLVSRVAGLIEKNGVENVKKIVPPLPEKWKKDILDGKIEIEQILINNPRGNIYTLTKKSEKGTESLLLDKYFNLRSNIEPIRLLVDRQIQTYQFDKALNIIFAFIDLCNEYVQESKPWKSGDKKVLYELKESILKIADLLWPFIPEASEKIKKQFSAKSIKKGDILFKKI
ncbi:MAG: class I tRNA ligase family protein [Nanoarchaeota archaeon]|nr:class I tRNA ligase family protein [Nanoarchaeota archaeon]